jgi:acid phosphatase (class A)
MNGERIAHLRLGASLILFLVVAAFCAPSAKADEIRCLDDKENRPVYYNNPSQVSLVRVLAPPPVLGSEASHKDVKGVLKAQKDLTPNKIQNAKNDVCESVFQFADVMGPGFTAEKLPFADGFFERVFYDANREVRIAKEYFERERPFVADPRVKLIVQPSASYSYPSGHSTFAYTVAIILADMVPERSVPIFQRADSYAANRAVVGAHYPADILAGRISGAVIDNAFFHNDRFLADYSRARAEIREALGLK